MNRNAAAIVAVCVLLLAAACAPKVGVQLLMPVERAPNTGNLDFYESAEQVGRPYKTIALLNATSQKRPRAEKGRVEGPLERKAREIGADGVIVLERRSRIQRNQDGFGGYLEYVVEQVTAEAIVYE
jgi:hypothetical protein